MANKIVVIDFPITESGGGDYSNLFRAFVEKKIQLRWQETLCNVSNNSGDVILSGFTSYTYSAGDIGKTIVLIGTNYDAVEGTITGDIVGEATTDIPFVSAISGTGARFYFKEDNFRMSYRFCEFTSQDDQSAENLFGNEFSFYPDKYGNLYIDISIIKNLLKPSFTAGDDYNDDLAKAFQVQYKTLFDGNTDTWHSAHDSGLSSFVPFISLHATGRTAQIDISELTPCLDSAIDGRMWRGYDKIFCIPTIDDNITGTFDFYVYDYSINDKSSVLTGVKSDTSIAVENGLYVIKVLGTALNVNARWVRLRVVINTVDILQAMTLYDTNGDENEFYLTWMSDNGSIRQWLFTNKILYKNEGEYDVLSGDEFRPIPSALEEIIVLEAKGLSKKERQYLSSLFMSNKIQVENNGQTIECVVDDPSWEYENRSNSYIVTCQLRYKPQAVMSV